MEGGNTRVYTTTDNDGNTVEVHEETYFIDGGDAAARLSSALSDSAHTQQETETLPDGSVVITTTITTVGDDGVETEEIITETIPPPAAAIAADPKATEPSSEPHDQQPAGRGPSAHLSGSGGAHTSKPIIAQYAEDEYSEYKPPKRYEKQQKDSALDKLAPKVTIMGLPKDHQQKTTASGLAHGKPVARAASAREELSEDADHGAGHVAAHVHQNGNDAGVSSHSEPQFERGAVENQPVIRTDVVRESDRKEEEELPEKGLARNLLSRFKNIESEAQKQKQYRPSGVAVKPTPTPLRPAVREVSVTSPDSSENHIEPQQKYEAENQPIIRTDVVKESDMNLAEELPETGLARNLLSKFKSMETSPQPQRDHKPSGVAARDSTDATVTWSRPGTRLSSTSPVSGGHSEPRFEGGEVENVPQVRTDVIKESDGISTEELPERGLAQNLLSKFKAIESEAQEARHQRRPPSAVLTPRGGRESRTSVTSGDGLSGHYEPAIEGGEFENQPQVRTDVVRESDTNISEDLPEAGLARNLLSRFKNIESEARESQRAQFKPSGVANKATPSKIQIMAGRTSYVGELGRSKHDAEAATVVTAAEGVPNSESGEFENVPEVRTDVVRESDGQIEELPNRGLASSLLSRFKSIEAEASTRRDYVPSGVGNKPTPTPLGGSKGHVYSAAEMPLSPSSGTSAAGSSAAFEPTVEGGEFENRPVERPVDVACEAQSRDLEELPEQGLAQGLLSKFKNLEEGASTQKDYRPSGVGRKSLSGYGTGSKKSAADDE